MKAAIFTNKFFLFTVCLLCLGGVTACSDDDEGQTKAFTYEEIVQAMHQKLYDAQGEVALIYLEDYQAGEWGIIAENENEVYALYKAVTGVQLQAAESTYEHACKTVSKENRSGKIRIEGNRQPQDGRYANLYFSMGACPEVRIIHVITEDALPSDYTGPIYRIKEIL